MRLLGAALTLALVWLSLPAGPAAATPLACTPTAPGFDVPGAQVNVIISQTSNVSRKCDSEATSASVTFSSSFAQATSSLTPWTLGAWAHGVNQRTEADASFLDAITVGGGAALPPGCPGNFGCPQADSGAILTIALSGSLAGDGYVDAVLGLKQSGGSASFATQELRAPGQIALSLPFGTYYFYGQLTTGVLANGDADFLDTLSFSLGPLPPGVTVHVANGSLVPEPGTLSLLSSCLALAGALRRRKKM